MTNKRKQIVDPTNQTNESLIQEIERLRMENAYLKKLNALVREKKKLQQDSKRK